MAERVKEGGQVTQTVIRMLQPECAFRTETRCSFNKYLLGPAMCQAPKPILFQ